MRIVVLVSCAITIEMPIELPMLRTRVRIAVPSVRRWPGSVANATVLERHEHEAEAEALHDAAPARSSTPSVWSVKPTIWCSVKLASVSPASTQ